MLFKKTIALMLLGAMVALAPARNARADDNTPLVVGLVMLGVGALGVGAMALAFSGKNFEGHVSNKYGPRTMVAKNEVDESIKQAFSNSGERSENSGEQSEPHVAATAGDDKFIKSVAPSVGYLPSTHTAAAGVVGTF